ncbi:inositol transport system ATP-binding protein [Halalkalibacter wakoensis JCM 9140]|uniref:Ribose/galactose/methyl galactoside import ATP-binding protein n=1 Tax=Halalkalibacter wakoensis JCM 9140 TaxID=1236970 RepID=W4Q7E3_9BACI|nr:sugar ABC transporter ATP-binding protein [Halalkalibacter wakoensis]GAE27981.1 inositol transport system ATP-binding protein [Halalkalibacter wakoensis JCM 9140]
MSDYILELKNVTKEFPGVKALDNVQLKVRKGSVHALMGENGAGKSTLMKIIIGMYTPDTGEIFFDGEKIKFNNINDSLDKGISMIHQELSPIPEMTIAENIFLGREPTYGKSGLVNNRELYQMTRDLLKSLEINLDPKTKMIDLSIANTQMVEIAKAISFDSKLVIMDEPTSAITEKEVAQLFKMIRSLKEKGVGIIYITHKMSELYEIADDISVFRDGQYIGTDRAADMEKDRLIKMMVGRELNQVFNKPDSKIGEVALSVKNLRHEGSFKDVNFQVRKGEIVCFAGLMGAGRTEVMETIFGVKSAHEGEVYVHGKQVNIKSPQDAIKNNLGFLTEDRKLTGLFLPLSVRENMITVNIDQYISMGLLNYKKVKSDCQTQKESLRIKTPNIDQIVENLSGGNQQKVLLARWLLKNPDILFLDEPTRGIDVGAKSEFYNIIFELASQGKAIVVVSSEMAEILGLCDRVIVMHEGKITGELSREEANQEKIMQYATGQAENVEKSNEISDAEKIV